MRFVYIVATLLGMAAGLACNAGENKNSDDMQLTRDSVLEYLKKCEAMIITGKDERGAELTRQHYMAYAMTVHSWLKDPEELEISTGIDRAWFTKVHDKFDEMWAARRQADLDGLDNNSDNKNADGDKKFEKAVVAFSVLLLKLEDVNPARLYSLKKFKDSKRKKSKPVQKKTDADTADET
jgi:hypothetical protein